MKDKKSRSTCLLGGDPEYCEDCIYGADYYFVDGECVERELTTDIKYLAEVLCNNSGCHHKCHDTDKCVVEDEALLLINQDKSNNFDVKSNNEIEELAHTILDFVHTKHNQFSMQDLAEYLHTAGWRKQVVYSSVECQKYTPTCKYGYEDCVWDPAYIKYHHPDWYSRLYGNISPEEASLVPGHSCMSCADNNFLYDDEDK